MIEVRPADLERDAGAIAALDTGFSTAEAYEVVVSEAAIRLVRRRLPVPIRKTFPLDLHEPGRPWTFAWVAEEGGGIVGFAAAGRSDWNARTTLWHLYVDAPARGRGAGRALVEAVIGAARAGGATHVWLETSNLNVPGVAAYRRLGFTLCGADTRLYDGTSAEGERALFFARNV